MNTLTKSISKTISTVVLATSLLLGMSVQAAEKPDAKVLTSFMIEQNTGQVKQRILEQLNNDIQLVVIAKFSTMVITEGNVATLLAKTVVNNETKTKSNTKS